LIQVLFGGIQEAGRWGDGLMMATIPAKQGQSVEARFWRKKRASQAVF
jgi:hypothetical protein